MRRTNLEGKELHPSILIYYVYMHMSVSHTSQLQLCIASMNCCLYLVFYLPSFINVPFKNIWQNGQALASLYMCIVSCQNSDSVALLKEHSCCILLGVMGGLPSSMNLNFLTLFEIHRLLGTVCSLICMQAGKQGFWPRISYSYLYIHTGRCLAVAKKSLQLFYDWAQLQKIVAIIALVMLPYSTEGVIYVRYDIWM